ncbi:MAG: 2-phosphosulfolactate phosphatase [Solobacterium sp.]|nr:2-phosphosulfolactate phosphatase [Solobacterium sp.]
MDIQILHLLEGAKNARGMTVIIDVFRAFSLECYIYACGAERIIPVKTVEEAFAWRKKDPSCILAGERNGIMVEGFDYGNAPSQFQGLDLSGRTVIHTTSAGVQGLVNASKADVILTGSLVNARAIADYIKRHDPASVSLVAMGWNAMRDTEEDLLCAEYIKALLEGKDMPEIHRLADELRYTEGRKFFDPSKPEFPEADFALCTDVDRFDGVIEVLRTEDGFETVWRKQ